MTTDVETAPVSEVPAPEAPKGTLQRVTGVLFSPDETFREIAARPNVLAPLLILFVFAVAGAALLTPKMDFETMMRDNLERSGKASQMNPSDVDRAIRIQVSVARMIGYVSPLIAVGIWALIAGVLLVTFRLFGGEGTYKQAFSATLYAWIPLLIQNVIGMIVAMTRSSLDPQQMATIVASNPAVLVDIHDHPVLFSMLSSVDLFTIWAVVLLIIGFAHVAKTSKGRAAAVVLSWWAVLVFFKVGGAALGSAMRAKAGS